MSRVYPPTWIQPKHYKFVQLVLCLALCYLSSSVKAQSFSPNDTTVLRISKEILNLITQNLDEGTPEMEPQSIEEIDTIFRMFHPTLDLQHREMVYDYEIKQLKKDLGINFNSSYYFNYDPIFDEDETNDPITNPRYYVTRNT